MTPARDPIGFSDVILGIHWIDHRPTQHLYHRISISTQGCQNSHITISTIGFYCCPSGLLSGIGGNKEEEEEKRYQALPAFRYCKRRKAGRGLGTRLPGIHCSRMRQVPLVTCTLLRCTKITVNSAYLLKGRTA